MTTITALPTAPARTMDAPTFVTTADTFVAALPPMVTQINTVAGEINALAIAADGSKTAAALSATNAANSATNAANSAAAAALSTNVNKWVSGTVYSSSDIGKVVWSPLDFQNYRLMIAGTSVIDPSLEDGNSSPRYWRKINYEKPVRVASSNTTTLSTDKIAADSTLGSFTITAPINPAAGETWFEVFDYAGTFATNNVIIDFGSNKFEGTVGDTFILDMNNLDIMFRYVNVTKGWIAR